MEKEREVSTLEMAFPFMFINTREYDQEGGEENVRLLGRSTEESSTQIAESSDFQPSMSQGSARIAERSARK